MLKHQAPVRYPASLPDNSEGRQGSLYIVCLVFSFDYQSMYLFCRSTTARWEGFRRRGIGRLTLQHNIRLSVRARWDRWWLTHNLYYPFFLLRMFKFQQCCEIGSGTFSWIQSRNYVFRIRIQAKIKRKKPDKYNNYTSFCFNCKENTLVSKSDSRWLIFFSIDYKIFSKNCLTF